MRPAKIAPLPPRIGYNNVLVRPDAAWTCLPSRRRRDWLTLHTPARVILRGRTLGLALLLTGAWLAAPGCPPETARPRLPVAVRGGPLAPPAPIEQAPPAPVLPVAARPGVPPVQSAQPLQPAHAVAPMEPIFDAEKQVVLLTGLRGEVVSFQLDLVGPAGGLNNLSVSMSDLEKAGPRGWGVRVPTLDRRTFELARLLPIRVMRLPAWFQLYERELADRAVGDFLDALVPIDHPRLGQPWGLEAGQKLNLWVDVPIAGDAEPGDYEGRVTVTRGGLGPHVIEVRLQVLPYTLPAAPAIRLLGPIDVKRMLAAELGQTELSDSYVYGRGEPLARKRLAQWIELGRRHGVQFLPADLSPIFKRDLAGKVQVDWRGYDELLGAHLSGGGRPPVWLAPFRLDYPDPALYGGLEARPFADVAEQYLRQIGGHFTANGWPRPMVWIHRDAPKPATLPYGAADWRDWMTDRRRAESIAVGQILLQTEMDIGYLEPLPWAMRARATGQPQSGVGSPTAPLSRLNIMPPHVTAYCPEAQFLAPDPLVRLPGSGREIWLGPGTPPWRPGTQVYAQPEQLNALAYLGRRYGLNTIWLGATQRWPDQSPLTVPLTADQADFLFYPGHWFGQDAPLPSLRLKLLRQAVQDAGYLKLLADLGYAGAANAVSEAVVKYALAEAASATPGLGGPIGWLDQPTFYADARLMLRRELAASGPAGPDPQAARRLELLWLQFNERTAWVRLGAFPGQLVDQLDSFGAPQGSLRAVFRFDQFVDRQLAEPTTSDATARALGRPHLFFGPLPSTWRPSRYNVPLQAQRPNSPPVAVAADGRELPIDATGRVAMPVRIQSRAGVDLATLPTDVPVLPAHRFKEPPRIDGELTEWPTASWFRGGGFRRLAPARPISVFTRPDAPATDTWFMAGVDNRCLYLAVACMGQKPGDVVSRFANDVTLDRGLVVDEDAVEVVLDPTGGRLDRQGLFHLVVKSTGTVVGWRGMTGAGGTGPPPAWGREVRAAITYTEEYWLIEAAIPLADLGPMNEQGLWRLNVARHLAARGEHSAWASACPLLGEPDSLGNLLLRPPPLPKQEVPLTPVSPLLDLVNTP